MAWYDKYDYCDYSRGSYPNYWCALTGKVVEWVTYKKSCENKGNGCEHLGYYISTAAGIALKKDYYDSVLDSIRFLKDEYLEKDEKYADLLSMYDFIGPVVAKKMNEDENKVETATKVYSILGRISKLVEKEEIDKATNYYSQMVGVLINKYDLGEFYEETNNKIELADNVVKKHKIRQKTLD